MSNSQVDFETVIASGSEAIHSFFMPGYGLLRPLRSSQ
jgi:hypothetical protein